MPTEPKQPAFWRQRDVIFTSNLSQAESRAVLRAAEAGELFKIREGIYTPYGEAEWPAVIARNRNDLLANLFPGGVIGWRNFFLGGSPENGVIYLTYSNSRSVDLPALKVVLVSGAAAQAGDMPWKDGKLHFAGEARGYLENLATTRGVPRRSVGRDTVRQKLQTLLEQQGEGKLNNLRDQARELAPVLKLDRELVRLNELITELLSTHPAATKKGVHGIPFDQARLTLFEKFAAYLRANGVPHVLSVADQGATLTHFAFLESYFSNYIEGTKFIIEEAISIGIEGKVPPARPKDAHDILGVMAAAANPLMRAAPLPAGTGSVTFTKALHATVMKDRSEVRPGHFKNVNNQAGNTIFVHKDLVHGTLVAASQIFESVPEGMARALLVMFILAEVHPFDDGNGRIARLVMNAELSRTGACRIIIPTLMREEYLDCLRALTRNGDPAPFVKFMVRMQAWTATLPYANLDELVREVKASNALEESRAQYRLLTAAPPA